MTEAARSEASDATGAYRGLTTPLDGSIRTISRRVGRGRAKEIERFIKFSFVGALGFVIDVVTVIVLQNTLLPPANDQNVLLANSVGFVLAVCSNFPLEPRLDLPRLADFIPCAGSSRSSPSSASSG